MNYIGKWRFHSIGVINESGELIYLSAEEYLNSPMPYIDETDEEAVADELAPIKAEYDRFIGDKAELERIFREGDMKAERVARKTYFKAMKKVGFVL